MQAQQLPPRHTAPPRNALRKRYTTGAATQLQTIPLTHAPGAATQLQATPFKNNEDGRQRVSRPAVRSHTDNDAQHAPSEIRVRIRSARDVHEEPLEKRRRVYQPGAARALLPSFRAAAAFKPPGRVERKIKKETTPTDDLTLSPGTLEKLFNSHGF